MVLLRQRIGFGIAFGLVGLLLVGAVEAVGGGARGGSVVPVPGQASLGGSGTATPFDLPAAVATSLTDAGLLPQATGIIYPTSVPIPSPVVQISVPDGAALDLVGQAATADGCWTLFRSPTSTWLLGDASLSGLNTITALGRNDVWAGGFRRDSSLSLHWDGATWQAVPSPNIGSRGSTLTALAGHASDDVWGVVDWAVDTGTSPALDSFAGMTSFVHWDGHVWRVLPDAVPGRVNQIVPRTADDAWAVGSFASGPHNAQRGTTVLHWDGQHWADRITDLLGAPVMIVIGLNGATAAGNRVWAVGGEASDAVIYWDGVHWMTAAAAVAPLLPTGILNLVGISASGTDDVWAVGSDGVTLGADTDKAVILHWDGRAWTQIRDLPVHGLQAVVALSARDVWAMGSRYVESGSGLTLVHWDGTAWRSLIIPTLLQEPSAFTAMSAIGDTVWLAGYTYQSQQDASARNGLVARLSKGACAGATATPARP